MRKNKRPSPVALLSLNARENSERVSEVNKRPTACTVCSLNEREYRVLVLGREGLLSEKSKDEGTEKSYRSTGVAR